jgi:hypothetical protein
MDLGPHRRHCGSSDEVKEKDVRTDRPGTQPRAGFVLSAGDPVCVFTNPSPALDAFRTDSLFTQVSYRVVALTFVTVVRIAVLPVVAFLAIAPIVSLGCGQAQAQTPNSTGSQSGQATAKTKQAPPRQLTVPNEQTLVTLIFSTLMALNQANSTGNYTVFRELGAPGFQAGNSAAKLSEIFAELRGRNFDLSPILLLKPHLASKPSIGDNGMLRVTGYFPTRPEQVNFDLLYQNVQGRWKLFGIAASTSQPQPAPTASAVSSGNAAQTGSQ